MLVRHWDELTDERRQEIVTAASKRTGELMDRVQRTQGNGRGRDGD